MRYSRRCSPGKTLAEIEAFELPRHGRQLGDSVKTRAAIAPASVIRPAMPATTFGVLRIHRTGFLWPEGSVSEDGIGRHGVDCAEPAGRPANVSRRCAVARPVI